MTCIIRPRYLWLYQRDTGGEPLLNRTDSHKSLGDYGLQVPQTTAFRFMWFEIALAGVSAIFGSPEGDCLEVIPCTVPAWRGAG